MWDRGLESIEAVVQRQECVPAKGDDDGLLVRGEYRRLGLLWAGGSVSRRGALAPLGDSFRVDAVAPGQGPQARLTMLYRSTDRLCRAGAPMKNLAHSASFHSGEKNAPSNPRTRHLASRTLGGKAMRAALNSGPTTPVAGVRRIICRPSLLIVTSWYRSRSRCTSPHSGRKPALRQRSSSSLRRIRARKEQNT